MDPSQEAARSPIRLLIGNLKVMILIYFSFIMMAFIFLIALVKLSETGWRFTYYSFAVIYGLWALWDKVSILFCGGFKHVLSFSYSCGLLALALGY